MDERFTLVSRVPQDALKTITAGRLKGKSDINPAWKTAAFTELYSLCGEGWYFDVIDEKIVPCEATGEVLLFMKLNLFYKTKEGEWSMPVLGYGGDYIVKKERDGLRTNDEAYKMTLTDALGNAMKQIGVAHSVYRGFWDGSKYTRNEESPLVQSTRQAAHTVQQNNSDPADLSYERIDGEIAILVNGRPFPLSRFNLEQLNRLQNDIRLAEIGNEIRDRMAALA